MPDPKPVYWTCANHHIIGVIHRQGRRAHMHPFRLALFEVPEFVDERMLIGEAEGDYTCYCSICGAEKKWHFRKQKTPILADGGF